MDLKEFCILGISRGVSYELGYSVLNPDTLKGIIISEYPPQHKEMSKGWAEESIEIYNCHCDSVSISDEVLKKIEEESEQVDFREDLKKITCPSLILKGKLENSLLSNEDIVDYINNLSSQSILIKRFDNVGHNIQSEEFEQLARSVEEFLISID